jgi:vacuolar-type H+-ATPase subunit F/Vma7
MTPFLLGEEEVVLGFALIGIRGVTPANREEALRELDSARARTTQAMLFVTETVADLIRTEIRAATLGGTVIQIIPGVRPARAAVEDSQAALLAALGIKL